MKTQKNNTIVYGEGMSTDTLSLHECKEQWASYYNKTWEDVQKDFEHGMGVSKLYGFEEVMNMVAEMYRKQL